MAIDGITGLPGAGKSHGTVLRIIVPALREGRTVVHNLPLKTAELLSYASEGGKYPNLGELEPLPEKSTAASIVATFPPGAVLVLDEAWRYWPAGIKASAIPEDQREFFAMHRHKVDASGRSTDVVLCCQDLGQLATFLRDLVETTYRYVKLTAIGSRSRFRCDIYEGPVTGPRPPASKLLRSQMGKYDPAVYACYQSHTQSVSGIAGKETKLDGRATIFGRWYVKAAALGVLLLPVLIWQAVATFRKMAGMDEPEPPSLAERSESRAAAPAQAPAVRPEVSPAASAAPIPSQVWRLAGSIPKLGRQVWVLVSEAGTRFLPDAACIADAAGDPVCVLDGELISYWTGKAPADVFSSFVQAGAGSIQATTTPSP